MSIIKTYNEALQAIYDHVGFVEDWVVYPIDDRTGMYWYVIEEFDEVYWGTIDEPDKYSDVLYKQRFYSKWIYEGEKYTMVFCDSQVDGMKWFRIFDNAKKINPPT